MSIPSDEQQLVESRLSRISTLWTMLARAHRPDDAESATARLAFIQRYQRAAYRYLLAAVQDADAADELFQELALRFVRGDFRRFDPGKGRFRYYLKATLSHLVTDYHKQLQRLPKSLDDAAAADVPESGHETRNPEFQDKWRDELFERAWERLRQAEQQSGTLFYTVLRYRTTCPHMNSTQLAAHLSETHPATPVLTAQNVRKLLQRAREQFAQYLLEEVAASLQRPTLDELELELIDLDLLQYCRSAWQRYRAQSAE